MPSRSKSKSRRHSKKKVDENDEWAISSVSETDSDDSAEEYVPADKQKIVRKSLRGILAYQAVSRQKGALIHSQTSKIAGKSSTLVGVSSRGVSGRGRVRVHGASRKHISTTNRAEMLDAHRRIVSEICESDEIKHEMCSERELDSPALTNGNFMNGFFKNQIHTYTYGHNYFSAQLLARITEIKEKIDCGNFSHRPKSNARSSIVWNVFNEIVDSDGVIVKDFFYCTKCQAINQSMKGTTTQLLRHSCVVKLMPGTSSDRIKIDQTDFDNLKTAAAKFVCLDLRAFHSVECPGFQEMVMAGVKLGQKYPQFNRDDLIKNLPGRKAIEREVYVEAQKSKEHMKYLLRESIKLGGLGCTLDLWTDKYKHNTYMAMTANLCIVQDTHIEPKRIVFYMGNITDIVKSKQVIRSKIVEVFADFGINETEIKDYVVFTTDR